MQSKKKKKQGPRNHSEADTYSLGMRIFFFHEFLIHLFFSRFSDCIFMLLRLGLNILRYLKTYETRLSIFRLIGMFIVLTREKVSR